MHDNIMASNKVGLPSLASALVLPVALSLAFTVLNFLWNAQGIVPKGLLIADPWTTSLRCAGTTAIPAILFVFFTGMLRGATKAANPVKDIEAPILRASKGALTNTIEQSFLFVLNILIASSHGISQETLWLLTAYFLASRFIFYIGYLLSVVTKIPILRSFGFAGSFLTNASLLAFNVSKVYHKYQIARVTALLTA
mmetsp:Transcript_32702/g.56897  ORF Transcript_32702/g.56897 Transcript_32702/m.56897 type:complete len:197 (+) Transcript_32702:4881-5471(+)